jgi:hypothetical protein
VLTKHRKIGGDDTVYKRIVTRLGARNGCKSGTVLLNLLTGPAGILAAYLGVIFVRSLRDMGGTV